MKLIILVSIMFAGLSVFAMNGRTTYQAKISKPNGYPLESSSVNFRFTVLDTVGSCILYVEDYAAINMQDTGGLISFALGNGTRSFPTSGTSMTFQHIFDNSVTSFPCQNAGIYSPGPNDVRKIVMQFNEGAGWQTLPAMSINSVPYAMYANESNDSKTLNGKADTAFVENATLAALNCQANEALRFNGANFSCVNIGVSATAVVTALGYTPVAATSAAIIAALGYTPADSAAVSGTYLVKTNNLSDLANVVTARTNLGLGSFATASSLDLGSASATGTIADARLANQTAITSGTQYTKVTVDGKGRVTNGANLSSSDVTAALGFTPADNAVSGSYLVKANNLSDLTNAATARTNLGLGTFATASSVDLGSASATGTIADARLANQSAITSGTQYTKVTVDGKGRVTNGANLASSDVTTALGYTPAQASSATQWITNGSAIGYTAGSVGIGTTSPSSKFQVLGGTVRSDLGASGTSLILSGTGSNLQFIHDGSSNVGIFNSGGGIQFRQTDGVTNNLTITPSGNIGIGTATPGTNSSAPGAVQLDVVQGIRGQSLDVIGTFATYSNGGGVTMGGNAGSAYASLQAYSDNSGTGKNLAINQNGGSVAIGGTVPSERLHVFGNMRMTGAGSHTLSSWSNLNLSADDDSSGGEGINFSVANSERMRIAPNGNVGIGTTNPGEKLEVAGKLKLTNGFSATNGAITYANNTDYLFLGAQSGSSNDGAGISIAGSSNTQTSAASGGITFVVPGQSPAMVVRGISGNVGIGTATPAAKLDVQGQVKTSMGTPLVNPSGNAVDFATGNTQYVTFSSCPGNALTVNLYSMFEGSSYSIVVVAPNGCVVDFTGTTNANGGSGGTAVTAFKYPAGQKFSSTGNPMVYSFLRANNFVFVAQVVDFQ